ncbi:N-acetyltransferase [Erysipelothrix sp. HDW6C]|uniref:N-acetyltransferase n=1 Tax=Erysipelothrix sp. HDW6C TaxID=2714930 RepID=UPI00140CECE7|nr:N-acetyltransferase [Erysipelothrix sp. HDW6C]QIK70340.1 N-acetyltransferase [Erysipelothrix sp. HDW6C]
MIRLARIEDVEDILNIFEFARHTMAQSGNPRQWRNNYPHPSIIMDDINTQTCYVVEENHKIGGVFVLKITGQKSYDTLATGQWHHDKPYGALHRLASNNTIPHLGRLCLSYCKARINYLRADTHEDNQRMKALLINHGFHQCGYVLCAITGDIRPAFDWYED